MKKIYFTILILTSFSVFSQNGYTMIIDGKEVFIKDDSSSIKPASAPTIASPNINSKSGVHIVKKGENLYSISRLYGLTIDELCNMNGLNKKTLLKIDQSLKIVEFSKPATNYTNASFHIVKKGDTLYSISKRYGISITKLKELNNLTDNIISINQHLLVN